MKDFVDIKLAINIHFGPIETFYGWFFFGSISFLWLLLVTHMVSAYQSTFFDLSSKNCMLK